MTDAVPDPPASLTAAERKFERFLADQGYPASIRWVARNDILIEGRSRFWVRDRGAKAVERASREYAEGLERNFGIALIAICATDGTTFASVFVPVDDSDRQSHLMGRCLKLSCAAESVSASVIRNPVRWLILKIRHGRKSRMFKL